MGVDCKGVHRVIHYGPAKNVEAYIQETGRAGRDGIQSAVYILYHGVLLAHIDGHMKQYVKTHIAEGVPEALSFNNLAA